MLKTLFQWLDLHPGSYWIVALAPTLLLIAVVVAAIRREAKARVAPSGTAAWRDALVLFLFLLAWRWPFFLVANDFNPDESQLIAGAITLTHDPVFWRSVDGTTSGPLNFYVLLPLHWLGLPLDYFTARLTGLLLIWGALLAGHRALAGNFGRAAAWLGVLPAAAFFATVTHHDLIHYSSEHLSLLLTAGSFWLLATRQAGDRSRLWAACFVAGTAPWAKLQAAPLALVLIGWGWWQVMKEPGVAAKLRWRETMTAGLAALAPTLLAAGLIAVTGQTDAALRRYFLHNLIYVGQGNERTLAEALLEMKGMAMLDGRLPLLIGTVLAGLLAASIYFLFRRVRPPVLFTAGGALVLAAVIAVITPRREFLHYALLLPVPLTLWFGAAAGSWWMQLASARSRYLLAGALLLAGLLPLVTRGLQPPPAIYGEFAYQWRHPRSPVAMVVHALSGREGSLGVWGWATNLYVESGLPQATRDAHTVWSILPSAQRDYHRACYLADLRRHQPAVFIDAVGPDAFGFEHRKTQAHEIFPELADYIGANYVLVRDVRDARIYARKGTTTLPDLSPYDIDVLLAQGRASDRRNTTPPAITPLENLTRKDIDQRPVMMILPPTLVEWRLDDEVREVTLDFGFDPEAYERGKSNGAELILELVNFEHTRQIYHRLLDPARRPADRGRQSVRVTLPPFSPGTHLVLRTAPGPDGDNAWDWLYFANLQFRHSPVFLPQQFPGFNRVPDYANADNSALLEDEKGRQLQLHAPGDLTYLLKGGERQLHFDYGFQPGAYADGGHTDGAIFRVELQRTGQAGRILFERYLQPARHPADRGVQQADLALPTGLSGGRLVISIDPGPAGNAAWDWTYVTNFTLQ